MKLQPVEITTITRLRGVGEGSLGEREEGELRNSEVKSMWMVVESDNYRDSPT